MLSYQQSTGELSSDDGSIEGSGFAGNNSRHGVNPDHVPGFNNPGAQVLRKIGPLPVGLYALAEPITHPELGPLAFKLTPDPANQMFGRDGFWIHGASSTDPMNSSEGCIVLPHAVRARIADSAERSLTVIR